MTNDFVDECLCTLQEECAEVVQIISKARRFGDDGRNPANGKTNKELIHVEIGDMLTMVDFLTEEGYLDPHLLQNARIMKRVKFNEYRKHEPKRKTINE